MARKTTRKQGRGTNRRSTGRGNTSRGSGRRPAPKKKAPLGVLVWITLLLLVLVMFLSNRTAIREVLDRTELLAVLQRSVDGAVGGPPQAAAPPEPPAPAEAPTAPEPAASPQPAQETAAPQVVAVSPPEPLDEPAAEAQEAPRPTAEPEPAPPEDADAPQLQTAPAAQAPPPAGAERRLFFAAVGEAGEIAVTGVTRTIDASASPLTAALQTLFAGPDPGELNRGLITLIPPAATLNGVSVRERIAYVDVSESFRFNPLGREGFDAQLRQLVLSATEFPGVEMVQLLIDGRRVDFLGSEGTYVGEPISRAAVVAGAAP